MSFEDVKEVLYLRFPDLDIVELPLSSFVFEERVKQKCYHCKNYNLKWTCPPHIPNVDYARMFQEYEHCAVLICKVFVSNGDFEEKRAKSTNKIHKALLYLEGELYRNNNSMALSFIGGSCKLCKNGCNKDKCANPYISRMPWEATGCNVISTLRNIGIEISFPITDSLHRYGLFLW